MRSTWKDHRDFENLSVAGEKVQSVCELVEFMSDQAFKLEKKMELVKKIKFPKKGMEPITLAAPHRKYVWEDDVSLDLISVVLDGNISLLVCLSFPSPSSSLPFSSSSLSSPPPSPPPFSSPPSPLLPFLFIKTKY